MKEGKTKTIILFIILIILAATIGLISVFYPRSTEETSESEVSIKEDFGSKIVYTLDTDKESAPFREHCRGIGGVFKECGTPCAPDAEICAAVCAYTCERIPTEGIDTTGWERFEEKGFDFSLRYPAEDWNIEEDKSFS